MSVPFGAVVLTLDDITKQIRDTFARFTDPRRGKNTRYTLVDAGLSAFSVFFMQSPSFLEYQRSLDQRLGKNNAQTLIWGSSDPLGQSDPSLAGWHRSEANKPVVFPAVPGITPGGRGGNLPQSLLLAFDGVQHFSSSAIQCPQCTVRPHANGSVRYGHTALIPVLVKPGLDKVIPLAPEFVRPQDGVEKQDCELNAAKRGLAHWGDDFQPFGVTLLGDDLYCHEPFCRDALRRGFDFIWVCKPNSHAITYEWLAFLERSHAVHTVVHRCWTGRRRETDTYRYAHALPLRDGEDALSVNWCELTTTDEKGNILYHNSFATSLRLDDHHVPDVVAAGRSRWKIENENNNTLKTKGYHFEHHYGHGQQHLSAVLASLIILAFLVHTVLV